MCSTLIHSYDVKSGGHDICNQRYWQSGKTMRERWSSGKTAQFHHPRRDPPRPALCGSIIDEKVVRHGPNPVPTFSSFSFSLPTQFNLLPASSFPRLFRGEIFCTLLILYSFFASLALQRLQNIFFIPTCSIGSSYRF